MGTTGLIAADVNISNSVECQTDCFGLGQGLSGTADAIFGGPDFNIPDSNLNLTVNNPSGNRKLLLFGGVSAFVLLFTLIIFYYGTAKAKG